jgi:serine/threonine-protein kinase HipA
MSPVQKLLYIGHRAMGALEFEPAVVLPMRAAERESLELALLVEQARRLIEGRTDGALTEILRVGASAGGARAKALVLRNRVTDRVRSGFAAPGPGDEPWLVKFDGVGELGAPDFTARPFNRIEYAYGRLARDAGIEMPEAELLETQDGLAHFAVRRFDRVGERRLHMHSLGGLMHVDYDTPGTFSYEQYFRSVQSIVPPADVYASVENAFRRAVFNIAAVNQDDHVKNFGFLMDEQGAWRLSPAFDLTFARGTNYTRRHQMSLNGKRDDFARTDILAVGRRLRLARDGADTIDEVRAALARWPQYAAEAGVPKQRIGEIAAAHRQLAPVTG